ncbi:dihydrolipoyl dehydrogenase [Pseudalkalibacillus salsuginis]|uniref:dihydrolipoyl dehydrogenase n=1 Tax=Pseudalkalibacillus salsuginis TaxID=2910972 RepID=UPI001F452A4D|nr:dihydrolipoyl dehydrogenase [Pseudalkalibacillus salsuginis]MCF6411125.1 dihydrolipoyl dehydrogenase [Pseudalkalibacillus salsuginis]
MVVGEVIQERELIIVGGGPGGYTAAIRAAQLGIEVTLIEKGELGGICLSKGCIPSKVFAHTADKLGDWKHLEQIGIEAGKPKFNMEQHHNNMKQTVSSLQKGVEALCKANKIEVINGSASFMTGNRIGVESGDTFEMYKYDKVIIATGASSYMPEEIDTRFTHVLRAQDIYGIQEVPEHLVIYGSDYIALEAATSFNAMGSKVTIVIDGGNDFGFDPDIDKELTRVLKKSKIKIIKDAVIETVKEGGGQVTLHLMKQDEKLTVEGSHLLVSLGFRPNTKELGLEALSVETDDNGYLVVNEFSKTTEKNVYAVGDVTIGPSLAVKAIKQGKVAAEHIAGKAPELNLRYIPRVVHTSTPIAYAGLTEEQAKEEGYQVSTGQFAMAGNGYAGLTGKKEGLVKIVKDAETDLLLGVHMIGQGAVELISSGITALEMAAREEDLSYPFYPHPSLNEGWLEALESMTGEAIHIPPNKQQKKKAEPVG